MNDPAKKLENLTVDLENAKRFFFKNIEKMDSTVRVYTHIDADGIAAGAILGKALYRANIPFQITVLRQLEREEILKIASSESNNFIIFSDFGSGQYLELQEKLIENGHLAPFLILDHHIPQNIANKEDFDSIENIHIETTPWQINPYFYDIDGSSEISGAGICYYFAKCLNEKNLD
ncbi:MAG: DHH family phosphoesterase, partial [Promethearchaeota archaeon]